MANIMSKFLNFMQLGGDEDDYDEDYYSDDEPEETIVTARSRDGRQRQAREPRSRRSEPEGERSSGRQSDTGRRERGSARQERNGSKIVSLQSAQKRAPMEVSIQKPSSFDDSEELADMIIRGQAVVVNFEGLSHDDAQRIMDFLLGCIYAMDGKLNQISKYIFLFSPDGIEVTGGDISMDGGGIPVFSSQF